MNPERNKREMNEKFCYANVPESSHLGSLDVVWVIILQLNSEI